MSTAQCILVPQRSQYIQNSFCVSNETKKVNRMAILLCACIICSHSECCLCIPIPFIISVPDLFSSIFYLIRYTNPWGFFFLYQDSLTHTAIKLSPNLAFLNVKSKDGYKHSIYIYLNILVRNSDYIFFFFLTIIGKTWKHNIAGFLCVCVS